MYGLVIKEKRIERRRNYDNAVVKTAKKCGYYTIQWDVDSLDWKDYGVDSIIKTVTSAHNRGRNW